MKIIILLLALWPVSAHAQETVTVTLTIVSESDAVEATEDGCFIGGVEIECDPEGDGFRLSDEHSRLLRWTDKDQE